MTDSSTSSPVRIVLDPQESLPDLLARVRELSGRSVVIEILDHSPILLTATEFRTLGEAASRANIDLTLLTEDRLRIQLANMFKLIKAG
ncbi:MAG TPA: hypothetical protein VFQ54_03395, partial [Thermomicrobiales bacterium]|nr:hypothetical protein [Thermomicrobiales bacterium]